MVLKNFTFDPSKQDLFYPERIWLSSTRKISKHAKLTQFIPFSNFCHRIFPPKISTSKYHHYKFNYVIKWPFALILPKKNVWGLLIDILTTESKLVLKTNYQNTTPKLTTPKKLITVGSSSQTDSRGSGTVKIIPIHYFPLILRSICCSQYHQLHYTCCYMPFRIVFLLSDICNIQKYCSTLSYFPELFKQPPLFLQRRTPCQSFLNPDLHGTWASF